MSASFFKSGLLESKENANSPMSKVDLGVKEVLKFPIGSFQKLRLQLLIGIFIKKTPFREGALGLLLHP